MAPPGPYEDRVLARLARFDAVLAHADPAFARVGDSFGRAGEIAVPVRYTGFVVGPPTSPAGCPAPAR